MRLIHALIDRFALCCTHLCVALIALIHPGMVRNMMHEYRNDGHTEDTLNPNES